MRLRIQLTDDQLAAIPKQYSINDAKADGIRRWVERWYPETLNLVDLADVKFAEHCWAAMDDFENGL